jgi:SAM-dependent methyltransferase
MGYFDWHEQPGYYRDVTRHFAPTAKLLDVGCGTGWLADHFARYTGIDGSPDAVAAAVERGRAEPLPPRYLEILRENSWERRVEQILGLLDRTGA